MKKVAGLMLVAMVLAACTPTGYTKKLTVWKDANGKVTGTMVEEEMFQPQRKASDLKFDYLKEPD